MSSKKELAIVLVSGGMDSLAISAMANEKYDLAMLHLNYGQNTEDKEFECFQKIAQHFNVPNHLQKYIDMTFLRQIGGSSLTDNKIKVASYTGEDTEEIPSSYVPFRNTHIIAMAVSWAEVLGATRIYIGAVEEDHMGYPDCRPSYYQAYNELIKQGTKEGNIEIITPIIHMTKDKILSEILKFNAPIESTWSCYDRSDKACGVCDSCGLRLKAFRTLGLKDPLSYV
jgi:7-cyano-7-deazaguanine synthase